jgi:hypothetical protein
MTNGLFSINCSFVPTGLEIIVARFPAINCWAINERPLRDYLLEN